MFHKSYNLYKKLRSEKYKGTEYDLSSNDLFESIISKNNFSKKKNNSGYLLNIFLILLSFITILKAKLKNINKANYFIVYNKNLFDPRSESILKKLKLKSFLNIVRVTRFSLAIKVFLKFDNVIFHQSIVFLSKKNQNNIKHNHKKFDYLHNSNILKYKIYKKIFKFLNIKKLIMIDDYREIQTFLKICSENKIYSVAYMHSRFSRYRVALNYKSFDKFIVWNNYFKKKLLKINKNYNGKILTNNFRNFKKQKLDNQSPMIKILYFVDNKIDLNGVFSYLDQIKDNKKIKIFIRPKFNEANNSEIIKYASKNNIEITPNNSLHETVFKTKPNFFMATNSNVLLEATLYNCYPILIKTTNDYSFDLIDDKVVFPYSKKNLSQFLINLKKKKYIKKNIYKKIWGQKNSGNLKFNYLIKKINSNTEIF
jgi:hypothetical protein